MFLKSLVISQGTRIIRDIRFKMGLNLIVDETAARNRRESGNNVGKTTILRLVDFCFGTDGKNIYEDPEFKGKTNLEIEDFLLNNNIVITLTLSDDLASESAAEIQIRRNFLKRRDKVLELNGETVMSKEFAPKLKEAVFRSTADRPTFRQIIAKNIRYEKNRLTYTLKVLDPRTRPEEYESLYYFWLGIEDGTDSRKQELFRERRAEQRLLELLRRETSFSQIEQSLIVVNRSISELEQQKTRLGVNEHYEQELAALGEVKAEISGLATRIGSRELRRSLVLESRAELEKASTNVNAEDVRALYEEASRLIPNLQRSFEETITFHNSMVQNKMEFISRELPGLETSLRADRERLAKTLAREKSLTMQLEKAGMVEDLEKVIDGMNEAFEQRGGLEEQKRIWESAEEKIRAIEAELAELDQNADSKDELLQRRIAMLNRYFSELSVSLYGERFIVSSDFEDKGLLELKISSIGGNPGTGKKRGEIAAFDLAYIQFADEAGIPCLHFVLQDQIENVHDNQISSLLTEIVDEMNCQYVLPVLRDKLPQDIDVDRHVVISLSQEDRLFRV